MRPRRLFVAGAVLALAVCSVPLRAEAAKPQVAVAKLSVADGAGPALKKLSKPLNKALVTAIKGADARATATGSSPADMVMLLGCEGVTPECLSDTAATLGAEHLVYGSIAKGKKGPEVRLTWINVAWKAVAGETTVSLGKAAGAAAGKKLTIAAKKFAKEMIDSKGIGVSVSTTPPGATISLDGTVAGASPLTLTVGAGSHEIRAELPGFFDERRTIDAVPGPPVSVDLSLREDVPVEDMADPVSPTGLDAPGHRDSELRLTIPAIAVLGAGAAAAVAGGVMMIFVATTQSDVNNAPIDTVEDFEDLVRLEDKGRTLNATSNVLLIAGGSVAAAGAALLVVDLLVLGAKKKAKKAKKPKKAKKGGGPGDDADELDDDDDSEPLDMDDLGLDLTLAPMLLPGGGGISIRIGRIP